MQAHFGLLVDRKRRWCRAHKDADAVYLSGLCNHGACTTQGHFVVPGQGRKRRYCSAHKPKDATSNQKTCEHDGCTIRAVFGMPGEAKKWCGTHRPSGAIDLYAVLCEHCEAQASFGPEGGKPRYCKKHKTPDAVHVKSKRCELCDVQASYGMPGGKPRWCATHKIDGAVDLRNKKCEHCNTIASFGMPDERPRWCRSHCPPGAINCRAENRILCKHPDCPTITNGYHEFCATHDTESKRKTRVRENQVANYLRNNGMHWTAWNKQLPETACGRYRPDFAYELATHVVIVEVDEMQHARPGYGCDNARMLDVFGAYGGLPVVFIRFNPDAFALGGQTKRVWMHTRMAALKKQLRAALDAPPRHALIITRLYYDQPDDRTVVTTCVDPTDPSFTERPV